MRCSRLPAIRAATRLGGASCIAASCIAATLLGGASCTKGTGPELDASIHSPGDPHGSGADGGSGARDAGVDAGNDPVHDAGSAVLDAAPADASTAR